MTVVALRQEWVEVWSGYLEGRLTWFVEHFFDGAGMIVSECSTEEEAMADGRDFNLPLIRR